jgi:hypothetical protein
MEIVILVSAALFIISILIIHKSHFSSETERYIQSVSAAPLDIAKRVHKRGGSVGANRKNAKVMLGGFGSHLKIIKKKAHSSQHLKHRLSSLMSAVQRKKYLITAVLTGVVILLAGITAIAWFISNRHQFFVADNTDENAGGQKGNDLNAGGVEGEGMGAGKIAAICVGALFLVSLVAGSLFVVLSGQPLPAFPGTSCTKAVPKPLFKSHHYQDLTQALETWKNETPKNVAHIFYPIFDKLKIIPDVLDLKQLSDEEIFDCAADVVDFKGGKQVVCFYPDFPYDIDILKLVSNEEIRLLIIQQMFVRGGFKLFVPAKGGTLLCPVNSVSDFLNLLAENEPEISANFKVVRELVDKNAGSPARIDSIYLKLAELIYPIKTPEASEHDDEDDRTVFHSFEEE